MKGYEMSGRAQLTVVMMVGLILLAITPVLADEVYNDPYWFIGIAEKDEAFEIDLDRIWTSLSKYPEWKDAERRGRKTILKGDISGNQIVNKIKEIARNVPKGDLVLIYYTGHGGKLNDDNDDEPSTETPKKDEGIGYTDNWARDDDIANAIQAFDPDVTVISIFDSCYAGGMVGGTKDLDKTEINERNSTSVVMAVPEDQEGKTVYLDKNRNEKRDPGESEGSVFTYALSQTLKPNITMLEWFIRAVKYGEENEWHGKKLWPKGGETFDQKKHWQYRPLILYDIDKKHDKPIGTPEPSSLALLLSAAPIGMWLLRRRRAT